MELLYTRIPSDMRVHLIKRVAKFLGGNTLPSVTSESSVLCTIPSNVAPEESRKYLVEPLLASIESEVPSLQAKADEKGGLNISKVGGPKAFRFACSGL